MKSSINAQHDTLTQDFIQISLYAMIFYLVSMVIDIVALNFFTSSCD